MTLTAAERQKRVCQILSGTAAYKCTLESLRAKVTEAGAVLLQTWAARNGTQGYWAFTARIRATTGGSRWMLTSGRPSNDIFVLVFRGTLTTMNMAEWREYVRLERYKPLFGVTGAGEVYALWTEILDKVSRPHAPSTCCASAPLPQSSKYMHFGIKWRRRPGVTSHTMQKK